MYQGDTRLGRDALVSDDKAVVQNIFSDKVEDKKLISELGDKFFEYKPKVDAILTQLKHANKLVQASTPLRIILSNKKQADLWNRTHEPFNVIILRFKKYSNLKMYLLMIILYIGH